MSARSAITSEPRGCPTPGACSCIAQWQPIETAPKGVNFLAYWPAFKLDGAGLLTTDRAGSGFIGVTSCAANGSIDESEALNATGDWMGDDWEYGDATHWMPLPGEPS